MEKKYIIGAACALMVSSMVATGAAHAISACPDLKDPNGHNARAIFKVVNEKWDTYRSSGEVELEGCLTGINWKYNACFHGWPQKVVAAIAPLSWELQKHKSDTVGKVCVYHAEILPLHVKKIYPKVFGDLSLTLTWK